MNDHATTIAELITKLLSHFGTSEEPLAVRRAIARDWLEDFAEFSVAQVAWACREWRRAQAFRPTIADIRRLATKAQQDDLDRNAIAEQQRQGLDEETLAMWKPEYHGDMRSPAQRRQAAIDAQEEKHGRAAAWREGRLDDYDARHHPDRLRERRRLAGLKPEEERDGNLRHGSKAISDAIAALGVTATEVEVNDARTTTA